MASKIKSFQESKTYTLNKWCIGLLSLGLMSGSVLAGSNSTTLPNGAICAVTINSPVTDDEFTLPNNDPTMDIPVSGLAGVTEGDPLTASFVYVMDISGSTADGGGTGCSPILNCEQKFLKALNQEIITEGISNEVGLVVYAATAVIADMTPSAGGQMIIAPNTGDGTYPSYVNTVVDSTVTYPAPSSTASKINQFTSYSVGRNTDCREGLQKALTVANATTHSPKIVVFTSDGICNEGGQTSFNAAVQALHNAGVTVHSIAVGTDSSCATNQGDGSLQQIADGTGGLCFEVPDPGNLPAIIPSFVAPVLNSLDLQVDGGAPIQIPNSDPLLPQPGPVSVDYTTLAESLGVGSHDICVTANCSAPQGPGSATQCETIQINAAVNHPPVAVDDSYTTGEDVPVSGTVLSNDSDPDSDPLSVTAHTEPSHGTLAINPDGSFTYTPNPNYCGTDTFTYTISDDRNPPLTDTGMVTINVTCVNDPPVANPDTYTTNEDEPITIPAPGVLGNDTDPDNDPLTVTSNTSPSHGTVTQNPNGSFTYTPNSNYCGTDSFTYTVSDGQATATTTVTLEVACENDPPVAVDDNYTATEDQPLTVPVPGILGNDTDPDGDPLTVISNTQPGHGTITQNPNGSFTYTPESNYCGTDSFTYIVSDGHNEGGTSDATVTINITCVNDPPVAVDDTYTATEDQPLTVPAPGVLANDNDGGDGGPLSVVSNTQPSHGTVAQNPDGSFTYTPNANFSGTDSYTYTISDGQGTSTATVTINVTGVNDPPVAVDDTYTATEDQPLTIAASGILANDNDGGDGGPLSVVSNTQPSHGTVAQNPNGSFTYTPNANFSGTDSYTYTISDGQGTSTATVTINVTGVNDPPVAVDDTYTATEDQPLTVPAPGVLGNDNDGGDGGPLSVVSNTQPSNGTVAQNPDGSFTYTPNPDFCGTDSFTYTLSDGQATDTATVTLEVACQGLRMTGGGTLEKGKGKGKVGVSHGFELHCNPNELPNNLQVNWNNKSDKFHLETLTSATCLDDPTISEAPPVAGFDTYIGQGIGRYNGVSGATITWVFTDAGEPGKDNDYGEITITDANGNVVLSINGSLNQGNHQAH